MVYIMKQLGGRTNHLLAHGGPNLASVADGQSCPSLGCPTGIYEARNPHGGCLDILSYLTSSVINECHLVGIVPVATHTLHVVNGKLGSGFAIVIFVGEL